MTWEWLAEDALIVRDLPVRPFVAAKALQAAGISGLIEAVASYETLGIFGVADPEQVLRAIPTQEQAEEPSRQLTIPVCYELGEDLASVSKSLDMSPEAVIAAHSGQPYTCWAIGFCPGFPYLGYLPTELSGIPRLASPRTAVPAGSVAITGRQTGIYPLVRPGGWSILGRTPLTIVDVEDGYFPIQAGDTIAFVPIDEAEFLRLQGERL